MFHQSLGKGNRNSIPEIIRGTGLDLHCRELIELRLQKDLDSDIIHAYSNHESDN